MPSKHIDAALWKRIEDRTVAAVKELNRPVKDTEVLRALIIIGLDHLKSEHIDLIDDIANGLDCQN